MEGKIWCMVVVVILILFFSCGGIKPDINSSDPDERRAGVIKLAKRMDKQTIKKLIRLLEDEDELVREAVINSLARTNIKELAKHIIPLLEDESPIVRASAFAGLGRLQNPSALGPMIDVFWDETVAHVKIKAIKAIARFSKSKDALRAIASALGDKNVAVCYNAYKTLRELTGNFDLPPERRAWEDFLEKRRN
jgi:HEAT repeat protein